MKNIWFLTVFIQVGFIQLSFSQVKEEQPVFKLHAGDFNKFLAKNFKYPPELNQYENPCLNPFIVTSVKFKVNAIGIVDYVAIAPGTQKPLEEALNKVINQSNGNWIPRMVNNKAVSSHTFILTIVCRKAACSQSAISVDSLNNNLLELLRFQSNTEPEMQGSIILNPLDVTIYKPKI